MNDPIKFNKFGLILLAALIPAVTGCVGAAAVGVGAGALVLSDRRNSETILTDQGIETRAGSRIGEKFGSNTHVNVTSYNRTVLLTGEAPDAATRAAVEKIVAEVANVKAIQNEIQVAGVSTLMARSNDAYLTSKVKARFVDANRFSVNHIKVVTEASVVYLMGLATQAEASASVDVARTTGGVKKVVRVFEIVADDQVQTPPPASQTER